ncbi:serine/threonine-protein kinase VRK3-like isoform X2 [Nyctibius grandis]|uniref:serine/threonine-protein kinase VRK3-like isoform X2 n=1 Tax=Nyctibius grandis TaxID=48427 RepID=UPI0035BC7217
MAGRGRRGRGRGRRGAAAEQARPEQAGPDQTGPEAACGSPRPSRFCPQCGRGVEPAFRFCPACGGRLRGEEAEQTEQTASAPPRRQALSPAASPRASAARRSVTERPVSRSPRKARPGSAVPLPLEAVLTDQGSRQWRLVRLLERDGCGLMYEAQSASGTCPQKQRYSLKLDVKDGKIYNEQNFFQRAAKAGTVEKWKKRHSVPLLGIPNCVGFGLHADSYRFLVFSDLGRTLQSVLSDGLHVLREKAAFQIVVRLVTLAGYCFAFRYCPGGKHVAQREGSRTPHEGTTEFISLDSHKGAGPSRRSDLESLGYCLLKWLCGFLPWSDELDKVETVVEKKEKYKGDVKCLLRVCFRQRSIPAALQSYLQQVMALGYEEKPDYEALRQLFKKPLEKMKASAYDSVDIKMVP